MAALLTPIQRIIHFMKGDYFMLQKVDFLGKSVSQIVFGCDSLGLRLPTETSNALLEG